MFLDTNYLNRPMFHGVIQKITLAQFFETWCTILTLSDGKLSAIVTGRIMHLARPSVCSSVM